MTDSSVTSGDYIIQVLTALQQWRLTTFGTTTNTGSAADTADPDGDRAANLFEYAFNSNPLLSSSRPAFIPAIAAVGAESRFTLTFNRIADSNLIYSIWDTTNLLGSWGIVPVWSSTGAANAAGAMTFTNGASITTDQQHFFRVKVAVP